MTSHPGKQRITIHILLNISRIKDNQAMKSDQYFSSEIMQKMKQGKEFQIAFCFLKKLYIK